MVLLCIDFREPFEIVSKSVSKYWSDGLKFLELNLTKKDNQLVNYSNNN